MIPISKPLISECEMLYVNEALSSGWISSIGKYLDEFEEKFASYCGASECVTTCNGTVAIHLALKALGIGIGDEVIVPNLTFAAPANAVILAGAKPMFVDINESDWSINSEKVINHINKNTKAIIAVHLYGYPCDMSKLKEICELKNIYLIEDAAEAHGALYNGKKVGNLGDIATFSFYGNKIITTGEGGAITTNSKALAEKLRLLRDHGMSKEKRYWHTEVGFNYRMTNIQAAIGLAQLKNIDNFIAQRNEILESYKKLMDNDVYKFNPTSSNRSPVNWLTSLYINNIDRVKRDSLIDFLKKNGIDSRPFFYPLSMLPIFDSDNKNFPISNLISSGGINLPTYIGINKEDIRYISKTINTFLKVS